MKKQIKKMLSLLLVLVITTTSTSLVTVLASVNESISNLEQRVYEFDGIIYTVQIDEDAFGNRTVTVESDYEKTVTTLSSSNARMGQLFTSQTYNSETNEVIEFNTIIFSDEQYNRNNYVEIVPFNTQTVSSLYWGYSASSSIVSGTNRWTLVTGSFGTTSTPPPLHNTNASRRDEFGHAFRGQVQVMRNAQIAGTAGLAGSVASGVAAAMGAKVTFGTSAVIGTLVAFGAATTTVNSWLDALTARDNADTLFLGFRNL